jgi:cytochrome c oxidase assembly factor CtaG
MMSACAGTPPLRWSFEPVLACLGASAVLYALGLKRAGEKQLGGLIMWVPGGLAYLIAGLALAWKWLVRTAGSQSG